MSGDFLGPLMFVVVFLFIFAGYPVAFSLGGTALIFAVIGIELGPVLLEPALRLSRAGLRRHVERRPAGGALLHLHGNDAGEVAARGGSAAYDRHAVRTAARRPGAGGGRCRGDARRRHRRGRRFGCGDGAHLAAGHAALRLLADACHRRDQRGGNAGPDHSAQCRARRARRSARYLGRRPVHRLPDSGPDAGGLLRGVRHRCRDREACGRAGACRPRSGPSTAPRWRARWPLSCCRPWS